MYLKCVFGKEVALHSITFACSCSRVKVTILFFNLEKYFKIDQKLKGFQTMHKFFYGIFLSFT